MVKRKRSTPDDEDALYFGFSPNQVVAFNLQLARQHRGWTQEEATRELEPYLGERWSIATYSAAERSVDGRRVRQFDADEIVAFARAFQVSVGWFFLPPPPWAAPGVPGVLQAQGDPSITEPLAILADLVFGDEETQAYMAMRLQSFLEQLGPNPLSDAQAAVDTMARRRKQSLAHNALRDVEQWTTQLRSIANQLEDLHTQAKRTVEQEQRDAEERTSEGGT